jgi:hypothetical protein
MSPPCLRLRLRLRLPPRLGSYLRGAACGGLVVSALVIEACTGVEADVLTPRPVADLRTDGGGGSLDGPPGACTQETLSTPDTQSCMLISDWLRKAQDVCLSLGLLPGPIDVLDPCSMMDSHGVRIICCPPPPQPVCEPRVQGDGMSCRDAKDWLSSAAVDCQSRGERLLMPVLDATCAPHRYLIVKYMCCADPTPTPAMLR